MIMTDNLWEDFSPYSNFKDTSCGDLKVKSECLLFFF